MRYLSIDLGDRRIGIAVSDQTGMIARPLEVMQRTSRAADFEHIGALVQEYEIEALVVGLPFNMDGTEGPQAAWVRDYSAALSETLDIPLYLWDERLTTEEAADIFRNQGKQPDKRWIDAIAAAVILQSYLDAHDRGEH